MRTTILQAEHNKALAALEMIETAYKRIEYARTNIAEPLIFAHVRIWEQKKIDKYIACGIWLECYYRRKLDKINRMAVLA